MFFALRDHAVPVSSSRLPILLVLIAIFASAIAAQVTTPAALSDAFAAATKKVEPAVVSIDAKSRPSEISRRGGTQGNSDDILEFLGRQFPPKPIAAVGSGFIVDSSGYVITNYHVVQEAVKIVVKLDSGEEHVAEMVGFDDETDIAVLKINAGRDLPFIKFGDSEKARVGDWVLAIGSPFGLSRTVTAGIISQVQRETPQGSPFQRFIQTDAAINRGNSGGPLVDLNGDVIGVNSQIATSTGDYNGIGFALPAAEASRVFEQIRTSGRVRRGYLGITLDSVKAEYAKVYGLNEQRGAIVVEIREAAGPGAVAGLRSGDIIVEFDGKPVADAQDLIVKVAATEPDRPVDLTYLREAGNTMERKTVPLKLGIRPPRITAAADAPRTLPVEPAPEDKKPFGLTLADITPELSTSLKLENQKGVVVRDINPASYIAEVKLSTGVEALDRGDIILRLNRVPVATPAAFSELVSKLKKGDPVVLHVITPVPGPQRSVLKIVQFTVQ